MGPTCSACGQSIDMDNHVRETLAGNTTWLCWPCVIGNREREASVTDPVKLIGAAMWGAAITLGLWAVFA